MAPQVKFSVIDALLPLPLIQKAETEEKAMMATATLVVNLLSEMIQYTEGKQPKKFDAFPGDRICQGRMMVEPELFENPAVCKELQDLEVEIKAKKEILKKRAQKTKSPCAEFFRKEIASLMVSKDVRYLIDCRLLKITRQPQPPEPSGRVISKSDPGRLSRLSKKFHEIENRTLGNNFRAQIAFRASTRLSAETMVRMQDYCRQKKVPELLEQMINEFVIFKPENYPPKTFGCQCFTLHLALLYFLEKKIPLVIKTIVPEGERHFIFFRAQEKDFEFEDLKEAKLLITSYVAVLEAIVPSEELLLSKVKEIGFIELLLRYAAQEPPFQLTSQLGDVKNPQGRQMLIDYRRKAKESGCNGDLLLIHHLYLNTIQQEFKRRTPDSLT